MRAEPVRRSGLSYGKDDQDGPHIIGTAGTEAWDTGEWSETVQGKSGEPMTLKGYWSTVDTRDGDSATISPRSISIPLT